MKLSACFSAFFFCFCHASAEDSFRLDRNVRDCAPEEPCERCEGDCDTDSDCAGELVCYQKDKVRDEADGTVPGCSGTDRSRTDFCTVVVVAAVDNTAAAGTTTATATTVEVVGAGEVADDDAIPGFARGMTPEIGGLWLGEEKYLWEGDVLDYCSRAFFMSSSLGDDHNFLSWHSTYLGNSSETCEDIGVDPKTGGVENAAWFTTPQEPYLLNVGYKACLAESECDYDVTTSEGYEGYTVVAKACGVHLKANLLDGGHDCELYQINRLVGPDGEGGNATDVAVLTYGPNWPDGGWSSFACPIRPTFDVDELLEDPTAQGTARFVLQTGYGAPADLTDWECTV